jgi:DNA-binding transcriptional MerR regulator
MTDPRVKTIGDVALFFGVETWQVRRLFQRGILPPAPRVGAYRVVAAVDLPTVEQALKSAGYLRTEGPRPCATA